MTQPFNKGLIWHGAPSGLTGVVREVESWVAYNFPDRTPVGVTLGLAEECGEVCRAVLKADQGIRGTRAEWMLELRKELGDVFVKLADVAAMHDIDLIPAILERWADVRLRDWQADRIGHGIG